MANTIKLSEYPTRAPESLDKKKAREITKERVEEIAEIHTKLVASGTHSILVVLQGMDGSGKDGATRNVFGKCAHYGVRTKSFKKPTDEEFAHDFLWRVHKVAPAKGELVIFNRSHYEDILIQRVHGWIDDDRVNNRMKAINAFEDLLQFDNNTLILKFYLHISYEQQLIELQERLDDPNKYWKHNDGDWKERELWDKYRRCYEDILNWSTTPWHIIPVDQRWHRDYVMSEIVLKEMRKLNLAFPPLETNR